MKQPTGVLQAIKRWQELRAIGVPAGSMMREMSELRYRLIALGLWDIVWAPNKVEEDK
jgi:hypothetical protein